MSETKPNLEEKNDKNFILDSSSKEIVIIPCPELTNVEGS